MGCTNTKIMPDQGVIIQKEAKPKKVLEFKAILHFFEDTNSTLTLYNLHTKQFKIHHFRMQFIPKDFDSIITQDRLFITGGYFKQGVYIRNTFEYIQYFDDETVLVQRAHMVVPKGCHRMVHVDDFIFTVGGTNSTGDLDLCEKFYLQKNKWEEQPKLNEKKTNVGTCRFNQHIYAIGGCNQEDYLNTIECFHTNGGQTWHKVHFSQNNGWSQRWNSAAIQINENAILIFGGSIGGFKSESFLFTPEEKSIKKIHSSLKKEEIFFQMKPILDKRTNTVFCAGKMEEDLHAFSIKEMKWSIIPKNEWQIVTNQDVLEDDISP